jgi:hypothetical protein
VAGLLIKEVNDAPTLNVPLIDQGATENQALNYQFAADTFVDIDVNDVLGYSATLEDGSPLPGWLAFDPVTRTFSGTPLDGNVGTLRVRVTATDGSGAAATGLFTIVVTDANTVPVVAAPLVDQGAVEGNPFVYQFDPDTFYDNDASDTLTYSAARADGSPLPGWLRFDPQTRTFSGTPDGLSVGTLVVKVTADDGHGGTVVATFVLTVSPTPYTPPADPPPHVNNPSGSGSGGAEGGAADPGGDGLGLGDDGSMVDYGETSLPEGDDAASSDDGVGGAGGPAAGDGGGSGDGEAGGVSIGAAGTGGAAGVAAGVSDRGVAHHIRADELEEETALLGSQIRDAMFSGDLLYDESQPVEFREAWNTILGAYATSGAELAAYLQSAFRTVTESACIYQDAERALAAMREELELAAAGLQPGAEDLVQRVLEAREEVKAASSELERAILAAAQAGKEQRFDRVLEDVIEAALQRLMTTNEQLFVESQALMAAAFSLREARTNEGAAVGALRLAGVAEEARTVAQAQFAEMRKSWDRVAEDVFAAFVTRLVAQEGGRPPLGLP